ncbi:MAG: hypothetical protein E7335_09230 [Clostridiales bacterium]|nr:hypothetical protein [Clostridiales bacterium]
MKKLFAMLIVCAIMLSGVAMAEATEIPRGEIVELVSGKTYSIDGETFRVKYAFNLPEDSEQSVIIKVGNAPEVTCTGWYLEGKVYAAFLDTYDFCILVGDYGPSDDHWSEIFYYDSYEETLTDIGGVGALPKNITINNDGTFSCMVRANVLHTWFRPADFTIAQAHLFDEEYNYIPTSPKVVELPRAQYPMGAVAYPTMDIPVCTDTDFDEVAFVVPAGDEMFFTVTDDRTWVMVTHYTLNEYDYPEQEMGYIQIDPEGYWTDVILNGKSYSGYEIFRGLLYAD